MRPRRMASSPIVTVNLWFDGPVTEGRFVGLVGGPMHWVFDKSAHLRRAGRASVGGGQRRRRDRASRATPKSPSPRWRRSARSLPTRTLAAAPAIGRRPRTSRDVFARARQPSASGDSHASEGLLPRRRLDRHGLAGDDRRRGAERAPGGGRSLSASSRSGPRVRSIVEVRDPTAERGTRNRARGGHNHPVLYIVVHYGELALKGRNRPWFINLLVRSIRAGSAGLARRQRTSADWPDSRARSRRRTTGRAARERLARDSRHRQFRARVRDARRPRAHRRRDPRAPRAARRAELSSLCPPRGQAVSDSLAGYRARDRQARSGSHRLARQPRRIPRS